MTSKCGKNKEVAHEPQASVSSDVLPHFDVFYDPRSSLDLIIAHGRCVSGHVVRAFVSDASLKYVDREGLGKTPYRD